MKIGMAAAVCAVVAGLYGCASGGDATGIVEGAVTASTPLGTDAIGCTVEGGSAQVALVAAAEGRTNLVAVTPVGALFALDGRGGKLTASSGSYAFKANGGDALVLDAELEGTWTHGRDKRKVTCAKAAGDAVTMWKTADGLTTYAGEIAGLAVTVTDEMASFANDENSGAGSANVQYPTYEIFAVPDAERASLALSAPEEGSNGTLPGEDAESLLDENDWNYGGLSACMGLGGGDDWAEWFQATSDGIDLSGNLVTALGTTPAKFAAHPKLPALAAVVDSKSPAAIEITAGGWTFLVPDAFAK